MNTRLPKDGFWTRHLDKIGVGGALLFLSGHYMLNAYFLLIPALAV